jgi:hypothetical protein
MLKLEGRLDSTSEPQVLRLDCFPILYSEDDFETAVWTVMEPFSDVEWLPKVRVVFPKPCEVCDTLILCLC